MVNTRSPDDDFVTLDDLALELCSGAAGAAGAAKVITQGAVLTGPAAIKAARAVMREARKLGPPTAAEIRDFLRTPLDQTNPALTGWGTAFVSLANHCTQAVAQRALGFLARIGAPAK